jgi:sugar lactone lactonase YvrE
MFGWTRIATLAAVAAMLAIATGVAGATSKPGSVSAAGSHLTPAGKITGSAATRAALLKAANLRTRAGAARYLRSIGLKPSHLVIQRGIRNYAGANCPGKGWSCTSTAHPVVQIASAGGSNTFQCATASCAVVQVAAAPSKPNPNTATCIKTGSASVTTGGQSCSINQISATANNQAIVVQTSNKMSGLTQTASFTAQITQQATGSLNTNTACVLQNISLDGSTTAKKGTPASVTLEAHQSILITQDSAHGGNTVGNAMATGLTTWGCDSANPLTQSQTLSSTVTGTGSITQNENAANNGANMMLDITQNQNAETGSFGPNTATFNQTNSLTAIANGPGTASQPVSQTQSSVDGGILAAVNQSGPGVSTASATQTETQCEDAATSGLTSCSTTEHANPGLASLAQTQFGPLRKGPCPPSCSTQTGNPGDIFTIIQNSTQNNDAGQHQNQHNDIEGDCTTSGNCTVNQTADENGTSTMNFQSGSTNNATISCTSGTSCSKSTNAFASGDVFVSVGDGLVQERQPNGTLVRTLDTGKGAGSFTTGLAISGGNLYVTDFSAQDVSKFGSDGTLIGSFGGGYDTSPESIVFDNAGNAYVGQADGSKAVLKFSPSGSSLDSFTPATGEDRGTDWIDLAPDQCTLYYTSEGTSVRRFNVCTDQQLADLTTALPAGNGYAVKVLPDGGALVADSDAIVRLNAAGVVTQQYGTLVESPGFWFSLALDPDGTSFWAGNSVTGDVTRFDLATGSVLASFNTGLDRPESADGIAVAPPAEVIG